jgi:DNA-binding phage protein
MPLTRDFRETVMEDMRKSPGFRDAMLREGVEAFLSGEMNIAKSVLRDLVNATVGFEKLSRKTKIPAKSLMRMLSPSGNPNATNLSAIICALQADAGVELHLAAE